MEIKDKLIVNGMRQEELEYFLLSHFNNCLKVDKLENSKFSIIHGSK
jgi:hypothetical protein